MFTVAIIGADGSGKTTVTNCMVERLQLPVRYIYMGINLESSNMVLPTTRLWLEIKRARGKRPDIAGPDRQKRRPKSGLKRLASSGKTALRTANLMAEEWFRQCVVWFYKVRGFVVIFDRHFFFDYYFHHIQESGADLFWSERLHGLILQRFYPRPDLVICLDAPAEVMFARKGEATIPLLEARREEYLQLQQQVKHFRVVDASQPLEQVLEDVSKEIQQFYLGRSETREADSLGKKPIYRSTSK